MKKEFYRQVVLQRGNLQTVGWIEERGAKVGCLVTLEATGEEWEVKAVSSTKLDKAEAHDRERDYLKQRRASDIKSGSRERF